MFRSALIAVTALAVAASAQDNTTLSTGNTTYYYNETNGALEIDPALYSDSLRTSWCTGQTNNCPLVCDGQTTTNTCNVTSLAWDCVCQDTSLMPNFTNYDAMMPSYICAQWKALCVAAHPNDIIGQDGCLSVTCGSENASSAETSSSTASSGSSATSTASSTSGSGSGSTTASTTSASASATKSGAAVALNVAQSYGSGILVAGLLGVFGLAL